MPLRTLFVDMNAYFASVEQQDRPELRGQPVGIVPTDVPTSCCIAASYEAKRFGIKTGTGVREARQLCPALRIVEARPALYVFYHRRILAAVDSCLPLGTIMSIDEVTCPLVGPQQDPDTAIRLAHQVKTAIRRDVGDQLRCSVGIAPNTLLAKTASDMQKPDGLTVLRSEELPACLYGLKLDDFPGIGKRMLVRLHAAGVTSVEELCALSRARLKGIWGSQVLADRWYRRLRGEDVPEEPTRRHQVGHSRVLPPQLRNEADARAMLMCLLHKAASRLRSLGYWTARLTVSIHFQNDSTWQVHKDFALCRDTLSLVHALGALWSRRPRGTPFKVGLVLDHLVDQRNAAMPMFPEEQKLNTLADTMDEVNTRFGQHALFFAPMQGAQEHAPTRIAFTAVPDV